MAVNRVLTSVRNRRLPPDWIGTMLDRGYAGLQKDPAQAELWIGKAASAGDYRVALAALKDEAELLGLYDALPGAELPAAGTITEVIALLGKVIEQTGKGRLDARTASTLGALAGVLLRGLEGGELAKDLAELKRSVEELRQHEYGNDPQRITEDPPGAGQPQDGTAAE